MKTNFKLLGLLTLIIIAVFLFRNCAASNEIIVSHLSEFDEYFKGQVHIVKIDTIQTPLETVYKIKYKYKE